MSSQLLHPPVPAPDVAARDRFGPPTLHPRRRIRWAIRAALALALVLLAAVGYLVLRPDPLAEARRALPGTVWPAQGQAAVQEGGGGVQSSPSDRAAEPIASVAKVMTAYLVLTHHPLALDGDGPAITVTAADVADTRRRRARDESIVAVAAGERLSERQALQALLLPSANNVAVLLARWSAGSGAAFVTQMNVAAHHLHLTHSTYTDPSGFAPTTRSTAADQVRLLDAAFRLPVFAQILGQRSATLPVAGRVHTTDTLLGRSGIVGGKTGSDDAAGGCFAFRAITVVHGRRTVVTAVVLGQRHGPAIAAGLAAAQAMLGRVAHG